MADNSDSAYVQTDRPRNDRPELQPFLPRDAKVVLDVGADLGGFAATLRRSCSAAQLLGMEPLGTSAAVAARHYDRFQHGRFPEDLPTDWPRPDVIVFADVLEHMEDPWGAVQAAAQVLSANGCVVASIPNIQFLPVLKQLLRGRWDYADWGILDRTHLRFFTRDTAREMFEQYFHSVSVAGIHPLRPWAARVPKLVSGPLFQQYVVVGRPGQR